MGMALEAAVPGKLPSVSFNTVGLVESTLKKLQSDLADIVARINSHMAELHVRLVNCTTLEDFKDLREKHFQSYLDLGAAIVNIVASNIDPVEHAFLSQESLNALEEEFAKNAQLYLGEEAYDELMFCLSTLKSTSRLLPRLQSVDPTDKQEDAQLSAKFFVTYSYVSLHLDCLRLAIERNITLHPEILKEMLTAIRGSVMVYSFARCGLDLRNFPASRYHEKLDVPWDAEDEALSKAD